MFALLFNNLFKTHFLHNWIEIDDYRYCECGILEQCDVSCPTVEWEDVSKNNQAVAEFERLANGMGIHLN